LAPGATSPRRTTCAAAVRTTNVYHQPFHRRDVGPMSTDRLAALLAEYADLERRLADPAIHTDQAAARRIGRRFAELTSIHKAATERDRVRADLTAARELAGEDAGFAAEAEELAERLPTIEERLAELLMPRDPNDAKDVILEI